MSQFKEIETHLSMMNTELENMLVNVRVLMTQVSICQELLEEVNHVQKKR